MGTLREFLLERILEEETLAQDAIDSHAPGYRWEQPEDSDGVHFAHWNPWRVLSGCVAKRLIIAAHRDVGPGLDRRAESDRALKAHACSTCGQYDEYAIDWPCYTLRVLALDWVDHPAYRQEWRPQRLSSGVGRAPSATNQGASANSLSSRAASEGAPVHAEAANDPGSANTDPARRQMPRMAPLSRQRDWERRPPRSA